MRNHGAAKPAFGYTVDHSKDSVVISEDTKGCQNLVDFAKGVDCLIHVAWSIESMNYTPQPLRSLASAEDAADIFAAVKPRLGVIYHFHHERGILEAIRGKFKGCSVLARDLTVINIDRTIRCRNKFPGAQTLRR
jgi:ribonuclease BN (tRNA processing enzyme)